MAKQHFLTGLGKRALIIALGCSFAVTSQAASDFPISPMWFSVSDGTHILLSDEAGIIDGYYRSYDFSDRLSLVNIDRFSEWEAANYWVVDPVCSDITIDTFSRSSSSGLWWRATSSIPNFKPVNCTQRLSSSSSALNSDFKAISVPSLVGANYSGGDASISTGDKNNICLDIGISKNWPSIKVANVRVRGTTTAIPAYKGCGDVSGQTASETNTFTSSEGSIAGNFRHYTLSVPIASIPAGTTYMDFDVTGIAPSPVDSLNSDAAFVKNSTKSIGFNVSTLVPAPPAPIVKPTKIPPVVLTVPKIGFLVAPEAVTPYLVLGSACSSNNTSCQSNYSKITDITSYKWTVAAQDVGTTTITTTKNTLPIQSSWISGNDYSITSVTLTDSYGNTLTQEFSGETFHIIKKPEVKLSFPSSTVPAGDGTQTIKLDIAVPLYTYGCATWWNGTSQINQTVCSNYDTFDYTSGIVFRNIQYSRDELGSVTLGDPDKAYQNKIATFSGENLIIPTKTGTYQAYFKGEIAPFPPSNVGATYTSDPVTLTVISGVQTTGNIPNQVYIFDPAGVPLSATSNTSIGSASISFNGKSYAATISDKTFSVTATAPTSTGSYPVTATTRMDASDATSEATSSLGTVTAVSPSAKMTAPNTVYPGDPNGIAISLAVQSPTSSLVSVVFNGQTYPATKVSDGVYTATLASPTSGKSFRAQALIQVDPANANSVVTVDLGSIAMATPSMQITANAFALAKDSNGLTVTLTSNLPASAKVSATFNNTSYDMSPIDSVGTFKAVLAVPDTEGRYAIHVDAYPTGNTSAAKFSPDDKYITIEAVTKLRVSITGPRLFDVGTVAPLNATVKSSLDSSLITSSMIKTQWVMFNDSVVEGYTYTYSPSVDDYTAYQGGKRMHFQAWIDGYKDDSLVDVTISTVFYPPWSMPDWGFKFVTGSVTNVQPATVVLKLVPKTGIDSAMAAYRGLTYTWTLPSDPLITATAKKDQATLVLKTTGDFQISATVKDAQGNSSDATITVSAISPTLSMSPLSIRLSPESGRVPVTAALKVATSSTHPKERISRYEILANGTSVYSGSSVRPIKITDSGDVALEVKATSTLGNVVSQSINVSAIPNTPPICQPFVITHSYVKSTKRTVTKVKAKCVDSDGKIVAHRWLSEGNQLAGSSDSKTFDTTDGQSFELTYEVTDDSGGVTQHTETIPAQ